MTEGQRVKAIRVSKGLTQEEFGKRIGVQKSAMSKIERGETSLTNQNRLSICREFGVSEAWLQTGEGDIFRVIPHNQILEAELREFLGQEHEAFTERLIRLLIRLPREHWALLARYAQELVQEDSQPPGAVPSEAAFDADDEAREV